MIYATASGRLATLTTCTKMQNDEASIIKDEVLNGNGDCSVPASDREQEAAAPRNAYSHGGRLKFFKDGKFILELERSREGERVSWVSVPRKTFWPPPGTAPTVHTYRQESSASLSVSDDNSSIQSSPWQRDHSWKQTSPRKSISKQLSFCFVANRRTRRAYQRTRKAKKPFDGAHEILAKRESRWRAPSVIGTRRKQQRLQNIVHTLKSKVPVAMVSSPVREAVVSPRKRFLREMEKEPKTHAEDAAFLKRSRGKPHTVSGAKVASPGRTNGVASVEDALPVRHAPSKNSSYSITSLLADDRSLKRSPTTSPSQFAAASAVHHPFTPPTADDRWYTESVDRLRSIELSRADKRLCLPYATPPPPFMPPFIHPYNIPPHYFHALARGFPGLSPPATYPMPMPVRPETPSCSWAAEPSSRDNNEHRDDNLTDMPLNLSKHAG